MYFFGMTSTLLGAAIMVKFAAGRYPKMSL